MAGSFHLVELEKIEAASKGFFRSKMRHRIARKIKSFDSEVTQIKNETNEEEKESLIERNLETARILRQTALANGASGITDPEWAAAAVVESWISLLQSGGDDLVVAEHIIDKLRQG